MIETTTQYYKVLNLDGSCCHGGTGKWPQNRWMPKLDEAKLEPCSYGYHVLKEQDVIYWLGPAIAPVNVRGLIIEHENKIVVAQAKRNKFLTTWDETTQRLFAADCAEHVLHYYTDKYPNDNRPVKAVEAGRLYARGQIAKDQLNAANAAYTAAAYTAAAYTAAAAYAAANAAAYAAATAAANAAAANAAAANAANAAANAAAYVAERRWQSTRLWQYLNGELQ